jgi:hypothetical protein
MRTVAFIDTSVLCGLLEVPGKSQQHAEIRAELEQRIDDGEEFVIPITAVIETGNHIAQSGSRAAAERFVSLLRTSGEERSPFVVHRVGWDDEFLDELCAGNATKESFVDLAGSGRMGAGDVAILVERDRFKSASAYVNVPIWTLEAILGAYS